MSIVTTDWLFNNLDNVKIIDSSWHLPNQNRNATNEYLNEHIPRITGFEFVDFRILKCYKTRIMITEFLNGVGYDA